MTGQKTTVLNHMLKYGGITQFDAFREYGIMRLAAVIHDLKRDGVKIVTVMQYKLDRDGKVAKRWALYRFTQGYTA